MTPQAWHTLTDAYDVLAHEEIRLRREGGSEVLRDALGLACDYLYAVRYASEETQAEIERRIGVRKQEILRTLYEAMGATGETHGPHAVRFGLCGDDVDRSSILGV